MDKEVQHLVAFAMTAAVVMLTTHAVHADQERVNEGPDVVAAPSQVGGPVLSQLIPTQLRRVVMMHSDTGGVR